MIRKTSAWLLLLGLSLSACKSTTHPVSSTYARAHSLRVEPVDVEHYNLELWLEPDSRTIRGRCEISYMVTERDVETLVLDLAGLDVTSVLDGTGAELGFSQSRGQLEIDLGKTLGPGDLDEVVVNYGGKPAKGLWFVTDKDEQVVQAWTQGECVDSHWWFPCLDYTADRATSEIRVHMPEDWVAVAAGERIDFSMDDSGRMEHWRMNTPHSPYLMTLCAGKFHVIEEEWNGIPLTFLADAIYSPWMTETFSETAAVLAFLSELTGRRYPYAKYSQTCVKNFPFGGMENISATTLTEATLTDAIGRRDGTAHGLVAHEAAHQWFGDLMTCETWSEVWLNEGFATYLTHLYFEHSRGVDEFRVRMRNAQNSYTGDDIGAQRRPTVHNVYKDPFDLFFDGKAYAGGASRLHLLRFELGDEDFFAGLRRYVADNAGRSVNTQDFRLALETVSGRDLEEFFEQWFYGAGYPELAVSWSWDEDLERVELLVRQTHGTGQGTPSVFRFNVDVELRDGQGRHRSRLEVNKRTQSFFLPAASRPIWVRFDKHSHLPARTVSVKNGSEWLALAAEDDDVNGRRDAVNAIGQLYATELDPGTQAIYSAAILRRLRDDEQEAVRLEAVKAFGLVLSEAGSSFLRHTARGDESADVREAALLQLAQFGESEELASFADEQFDVGYSWDTRIASAKLYAAAAPVEAQDWLLARSNIPSPHSKLRAGLLEAQVSLGGDELLLVLKDLSQRVDLDLAVRLVAVEALGVYSRVDREARDILLALLETEDYRLRQEVIDALARSRDAVALARLRSVLNSSVHSRERRNLEAAIATLSRSSRN